MSVVSSQGPGPVVTNYPVPVSRVMSSLECEQSLCVIIRVREVKQHGLVTNNTNDSDCKKARPGPLEVKYISQTINCQAGDNT